MNVPRTRPLRRTITALVAVVATVGLAPAAHAATAPAPTASATPTASAPVASASATPTPSRSAGRLAAVAPVQPVQPSQEAADPTSTSALTVPASVTAGGSADATLTVTTPDEDADLTGTAQLLVAGKAAGSPVAVSVDGATATATLPVPASVTGKVGTYELSATFTGSSESLGSTAPAQTLTVLPATLPWSFVDENGKPVTDPISSFGLVAHATGQLPGSTVFAQTLIDGTWEGTADDLESAVVEADGTADVPLLSPQLVAATGDIYAHDQAVKVRLVAKFETGDPLVGATRTVTIPAVKVPIDLQVEPGPYRSGADVGNAVRVTFTWFGEEILAAGADEIIGMLDEGSLTLLVDGKALDPRDVDVDAADDETAVFTFAAPTTGGEHTVQAVLDATEPKVHSESKVRHFVVAPSTFATALLDEDGNEVTEVHRGQELEAVAAGLLPGTKVSFVLHSTPTTLGTATADEDGIAAVAVTIPSDVAAGDHTLVVTAKDVLGDKHVEKVALTAVVPVDAPTGELAETGSDVTPLVIGGALLLLVGAGLVLVRRRRA